MPSSAPEARASRLALATLSIPLALACATAPAMEDVRRLGEERDNERLLESWRRSEDPRVRAEVLGQLARSPDDRGRALSVSVAREGSSAALRGAAVSALARYEGDDVVRALIAALGDPWPEVRAIAQDVLQRRERLDAGLLAGVSRRDPSPLVRAALLRVLSARPITDAAALPSVEALLLDRAVKDDAAVVRRAAAEGLGELGIERGRPVLLALFRTDGDRAVRLSAERALRKLGPSPEGSRPVVLVLPLRNATGLAEAELEGFVTEMASYVAARLASAEVCEVVDRKMVDEALAEMRKVGRAIYDGDAPSVPEIGAFKLANQLVYGALQREGHVFTVILHRLDVATLGLVPGASAVASGYRADLHQLKVEATERLVGSFR